MRNDLWDRMMYRLLQEKKEKEIKAAKKQGSKPDFLDLDKDGNKAEPMSKASREAGNKKDKPKAKKGKGKIPPQLRMSIKKKQSKRSKLDEAIKRLEKILIEGIGNAPKQIDRKDYIDETDNTDQFSENDELQQALSGTSFENMTILNAGKHGDVVKFTNSKGEEDLILPMKKTDEFLYFKTNEKDEGSPRGKYYKISISGDEENLNENHDDYDDDDDDDDQELCPICDKPEEECECDPDSKGDDLDLERPRFPGEPEEDEESTGDDFDPYNPMFEEIEYLSESEVKKKKPALGKVTRNPAGSKKKFHVYVKCGGRVKKISFGDPGLSIKRDSAARRKNFRARHKCDKPAGKDRCTARYWSCYQWRAGKKVEGE